MIKNFIILNQINYANLDLIMLNEKQSSNRLPEWMQSPLFQGVSTLLLWLGSAALSFYTLLEFQFMIFRLFIACCSDNRWGFTLLRQWSSIFLIGFWLAFTIITGEYHYQNVRKKKSWRLFGRSYLGMVILLVISLLVM